MKGAKATAWAKRLGISVKTLHRAVERGELPDRKTSDAPNAAYFFLDDEMDEWVNRTRIAGKAGVL